MTDQEQKQPAAMQQEQVSQEQVSPVRVSPVPVPASCREFDLDRIRKTCLGRRLFQRVRVKQTKFDPTEPRVVLRLSEHERQLRRDNKLAIKQQQHNESYERLTSLGLDVDKVLAIGSDKPDEQIIDDRLQTGIKFASDVKLSKPTTEGMILNAMYTSYDEIIRLVFIGSYTAQEIAEMCDCSVSKVSSVIKSSYGQQRLRLLQGARDYNAIEIALTVQAKVKDALETVSDCMQFADRDETRLRAAQQILGMSESMSPMNRIKAASYLTSEKLHEIKTKALTTNDLQPDMQVDQ